jgi:hypothetical protein
VLYQEPQATKPVLDYRLCTRIHDNGDIELALKQATEQVSQWLIKTREQAIRQALIALGWTPPPEL